ncbi:hypothetical protein BDV27DRAFT_88968 [Aspergillus caelatus]|uniref:Uncharacterized protein n=1 Tax=Aspergillus caelatus TaxID=61420 RepID=A0A5N6ZI42_9EURO|nr:uncharacterized protein BDV27DRAFT_88968 [Aspergillus caelatus]KAE8357324.1 hypothetical protein BDV27DRAFT_88968 [Aspergillus caelatus]
MSYPTWPLYENDKIKSKQAQLMDDLGHLTVTHVWGCSPPPPRDPPLLTTLSAVELPMTRGFALPFCHHPPSFYLLNYYTNHLICIFVQLIPSTSISLTYLVPIINRPSCIH